MVELGGKDRRRSARRSRAIKPEFLALEKLAYTSAVPAFFRDPSYAYGPSQTTSTSFVPSVLDEDEEDYTVEDDENGDAGSNAASYLSNDIMDTEESGGGESGGDDVEYVAPTLITATEDGAVTNTIAAPDSTTGSNTQAVEVDVSHSHIDTVSAAANVTYAFGSPGSDTEDNEDAGPYLETEAKVKNPMVYDLTESDGTAITSGSVTLNFSVTLSAMTGNPSDDGVEFNREADLQLTTTYFNANVSVGGDLGGHSGGADGLTVSDSIGDEHSDSTFGADDSVVSTYTFTATIPISSNATVSVDYDSYDLTYPTGNLDTTATGSGGASTVVNRSSFSWSFSMVANP